MDLAASPCAGDPPIDDPAIAKLARLFREDPVWVDAMGRIKSGANSVVYFGHRPGEPWHVIAIDGLVCLRPGPAPDPDFAFCFTPTAIDALAAVEGGIDDVAVRLFDLILAEEVGFRIIASFWRLIRHGHLRLVLDAGPKVIAYGAQHGIRTLGQLTAFVKQLRSSKPMPCERDDRVTG
jgi:hypothetical protein